MERKAIKKLESASMHISGGIGDPDAMAILSRAMDRVANDLAFRKKNRAAARAAEMIPVVCLECGEKFRVRVYADECPKCGGVDIDVRE